jgi:RNA polymerase sigma-70 factor (ECF subfamily)
MDGASRTPDPERLLEHTAFLRSVAAALLQDVSAVDDVVQETWVAALTRPPRSGWKLEAWLGGVAANLARSFRRSGARRSRREAARAQPEALPSAAETVSRLETLRRVVEAVQALDEPYQAVVLLRHFDGLPPREIARRLGVPVETVGTRLRRAHEKLRSRLDAEHGDDRGAWSLLLAPWVELRSVTEAGSLGSMALLGGGLLMKMKVVFGAAAVLLLAALLGWWWLATPSAPMPVAGGPVVAAASELVGSGAVAEPPLDPPPAGALRESVFEPGPEGRLVVRGRAVHGSVPFPRARLRARAFGGANHDEPLVDARVVADEQGDAV